MFPCLTKLQEGVDWGRLDTPQSMKAEDIHYGTSGLIDPRFAVLDKNHSHSLVIRNVTANDSAYYRCIEDGGLGNRHYYGLTVKGIFLHCPAN